MIDLVYPLGNGSPWNDNELRYSLRSVEKHLSGFGNVYLIGRLPHWAKNVIHVPAFDNQDNKEKNIAWKVLKACDIAEVSEDFLFMNDDHILCGDMEAAKYPYYFNMTVQQMILRRNAGIKYQRAMQNVINVYGLDAKYYDIHVPILYNKSKFKQIVGGLDWSVNGGYVVKSAYANGIECEPVQLHDVKVNKQMTVIEYENIMHERPCFSFGDRAIGPAFRAFLEKTYPKKSIFEK